MALKCERQWTRSGCPVTDRELTPYLVLAATEGMVRPGLSSAHTLDQILKSSNLGKEGWGGHEAGGSRGKGEAVPFPTSQFNPLLWIIR